MISFFTKCESLCIYCAGGPCFISYEVDGFPVMFLKSIIAHSVSNISNGLFSINASHAHAVILSTMNGLDIRYKKITV